MSYKSEITPRKELLNRDFSSGVCEETAKLGLRVATPYGSGSSLLVYEPPRFEKLRRMLIRLSIGLLEEDKLGKNKFSIDGNINIGHGYVDSITISSEYDHLSERGSKYEDAIRKRFSDGQHPSQ